MAIFCNSLWRLDETTLATLTRLECTAFCIDICKRSDKLMQVWAAFVWTKPYPVFPAFLLLDLSFSNPTRLPPPPPYISICERRSIGCRQNIFKINPDCAKFYFNRLIFRPLLKFYTSFTVITPPLKSFRHQRNQLPPKSRIATNG